MANAQAKVDRNGRVVIPAGLRRAAGLRIGDKVAVRIDKGEIRLIALHQAIKRAQETCRPYRRKGKSMVDELIAERRKEAARE